jgi:hypothetical protein
MNRLGAACGLVGVAGNILGVVALRGVPSAYRPQTMPSWVAEVLAAPEAVTTSAIAFTIGLLALAGWALILGSQLKTPAARVAGAIIAVGAAFNAAGTVAPLVLALHLGPACGAGADCLPAGLALLGMSLAFDALFNLLLGVGLVVIAGVMWKRRAGGRWLAPLAGLAGAASIPVSLQISMAWAARLLIVAGPLWLIFITVVSLRMWKGRM